MERDRIAAQFEIPAEEEERVVLGRTILRLLSHARGMAMLTPYLEDVGRVDLPMGLIQAVDILIEALLPTGADPVIHLDEHDMYSALNLMPATASVRTALGVTENPTLPPIVLFLPSMDPFNALLLPILGHEVGHPAIEEHGLVSTALANSDVDALNTLLDECMTAANETDATSWQVQLFGWLETDVRCPRNGIDRPKSSLRISSISARSGSRSPWHTPISMRPDSNDTAPPR